jgi:putative ABC transport system permease protein
VTGAQLAAAVPPVGAGTAIRTLVVLAICAAGAAGVLRLAGLEYAAAVPRAAVRALVQLVVVALVIAAVLGSTPLSLAFVATMTMVAALTATRRVTRHRSGLLVGVGVAGGALPVLALLVASGLVPWSGAALVPTGGILVGGAMTAAGLSGRLAMDALADQRDVWEGALALGLPERTAGLLVVRPAAGRALLPALDQTRTVGTVTLPGTFVGLLLGGATPLQAAGVQLVVLVALLLVQAIAIAVTVELVARRLVRPTRAPDAAAP